MSLTDQEFMFLLTLTVVVVMIAGWIAIVRTLHQVNHACEVLLKRTELLEAHVLSTLPEGTPPPSKDVL